MKLGVVYHIEFWRGADGLPREAEGSFARYVDSIAPYWTEIQLAVPVLASPRPGGVPITAANVRLAPLPAFAGPRQFYPRLPGVLRALRRLVAACDVLHCRVPTPAALPAFLLARRRRRPVFLLVVGDLAALLPSMPYRSWKRAAYTAYVALEERALRYMTPRSLTFTNGAALAEKHRRHGADAIETRTTTLHAADINDREDTCGATPLRLLCVSRVEPRKGLRALPGMVAALAAAGEDVRLDIVGPTVSTIGVVERDAVIGEAARLGVSERVRFTGPLPLDTLMARYREYDVFVLPTRAGEGVPRVLLEAMAAGLPVVTTRVSGIPSLIVSGMNGLLVAEPSAAALAEAVGSVAHDPALRQRLIKNGYETARAHTLEHQARSMMAHVRARLPVDVREVS